MNDRDESVLADALVAASAAVRRFETRRRTTGRLLLAAAVLVAGFLGSRARPQPVVYVIHGDSTGVVLTGPGIARRLEAAPPPPRPRNGDRT